MRIIEIGFQFRFTLRTYNYETLSNSVASFGSDFAMDKLATLLMLVCICSCSCMKSWEVPERNLWEYIDKNLDENWLKFQYTFNKTYQDEAEEMTRRLYWEDTLRFIEDHNQRYGAGEETYFVGENHFADLAEDEFQQIYLTGLVIPENEVRHEGLTEPDPAAPSTVDWRSKLVTSVKNQGSCGSCWAFSANGALEGQLKKRRSNEPDLSEQNLVDCANRQYGNYGCRGGWMNNAFKYMKVNGINSENCYPYKGRDGYCRFNRECIIVKDKGTVNVGKSEHSLQSDLARVGPIAIAVDASGQGFQSYRGGVYNNPRCSSTRVTHAMLATGYGSSRGRDYWTVKNSWGAEWGAKGYVYMTRNRNNQCGIANYASYPVL